MKRPVITLHTNPKDYFWLERIVLRWLGITFPDKKHTPVVVTKNLKRTYQISSMAELTELSYHDEMVYDCKSKKTYSSDFIFNWSAKVLNTLIQEGQLYATERY